jgi:hypothetical protein
MRTLDQAIRAASRRPRESLAHSHWMTQVDPGKGNRKTRRSKSAWRHNLTTTTATGYTNAFDWLAKAMGAGPSAAFATVAAWAVAGITITATTLTAPTGFPTAGQGLAGQIVVVFGLTSQTIRYGIIVSNTATVLTVDQWYDATSTTGASGATPTTSGGSASTGIGYIVLPGQNPASWMAITADAVAPTTADTTLASELTTNGFSRAVGTYSHTAAASTYTLVHLWTCSGGSTTINKEAQFGAATTTAGGVMPFESAEPSPPTLISGDTLQNTVTITI